MDWCWSRQFFYARLRRRLAENNALQRMSTADPTGDRARHKQLLQNVIKAQVKDQKKRLPSYDNIEHHVMETKVSRSEEDKKVSECALSTTTQPCFVLSFRMSCS